MNSIKIVFSLMFFCFMTSVSALDNLVEIEGSSRLYVMINNTIQVPENYTLSVDKGQLVSLKKGKYQFINAVKGKVKFTLTHLNSNKQSIVELMVWRVPSPFLTKSKAGRLTLNYGQSDFPKAAFHQLHSFTAKANGFEFNYVLGLEKEYEAFLTVHNHSPINYENIMLKNTYNNILLCVEDIE